MKQVYLLYGEDYFLLEKFEKEFVREKVSPEWETFNIDNLDAEDASVDRIVESADSPPFGFGNKVTLVRNANKLFEVSEENLVPLTSLLDKGLMETNFLIFSSPTADKRRNIVKALLKVAEVKEFGGIKPWEVVKKLYPWVEDVLRKEGKRIEQSALEELVESTGANKQRLEKEIEKLMAYIGDNKIITYNDVRALVVNTESDLFELLALLPRKETGNAMEQIGKLLMHENHIKLIASIASNLRSIYNVKLLADKDLNNAEIAKQLNQKPFVVEKTVKAWRNFNTTKLRESLQYLLELDYRFKSSSVNHKLEFEKFIIKFFG